MSGISRYFLNGAAGAGGESPWLIYNENGTYVMDGVAVSADYVYQTGQDNSGSGIYVAQFDHEGTLNWQNTYTLGGATYRTYPWVDSSQNLLVATTGDLRLSQITTTGSVGWSRGTGRSALSTTQDVFAWDATNNRGFIRYAGTSNFEQNYFTGSPPTMQWARYVGTSDANGGITHDTSGNSWSCSSWASSPYYKGVIVKRDSSGNMNWSKTFQGSTNDVVPQSVAWSDNGNLFVGYKHNTNGAILQVLNASSGNMSSRYAMTGVGSANVVPILRMDNEENRLYCLWTYNASNVAYFTKHTSNGSLVWQNKLTGMSALNADAKIAIYGDFVYYSAKVNNTQKSVLFKFPKDGSGQGTYGPFTYAAGTATYGNSTSGDLALNSTTWAQSQATRSWSNNSMSGSSTSGGTITLYEKS